MVTLYSLGKNDKYMCSVQIFFLNIFDLWLVGSADAYPTGTDGQLCHLS